MRVEQRKKHLVEFREWLGQGYMSVWLTVPFRLFAPEYQKCYTYETANRIRQQVIPTGMTTRKIDLMPLIQHTDQQCADNCDDQPARPLQSAGQSDTTGKHGEGYSMKKFIPWCGNQIDGNRLRSPKKQIQNYHHNQHRSCDTQEVG